VRPSPSAVTTLGSTDHRDAVVRLTLENPSDRRIHVTDVRISYLRGSQILKTEERGPDFFTRDRIEREDRIDRGTRVDWPGICLSPVPDEADRVRFDLELSTRRGIGQIRSLQSVDVPLRPAPSPRALKLPFQGMWRISQGHTCRTDHRIGGHGGDFAWDFHALDPGSGASVNEVYSITRRNRDTVTFGRPILAPADGRVVRVVNDEPDNEGLRDFPRRSLLEDLSRPLWIIGNHVVLDLGDSQYLLLGHLKQGSILVKPGDDVRVGEPLAAAGNSGNSIEPHLHIQVMDRDDPTDPAVAGVPALFRDYLEITGHNRDDRRDATIRRIDAGDPPEGGVVRPFPPERSDPRNE